MGLHNQRLGRRGERLAAQWYRDHGYELVDRNWRCAEGELDLVLRRGPIVVFCEVKARTTLRFGHPAEAVTPAKQARIHRLALRWLFDHRISRRVRRRFDVAAVVGSRVSVIEGAF